MVIPGFDKAVLGMKVGEEKEFTIAPAEAYGEYNPELTKEIPKNVLPKEQEPKEGMTLMVGTPQGQFPVRISKVLADRVVIDLNHPLAGKVLIFKIKVLSIN
jgi:peptidylprolyl isomerase